MYAYFLFLMHWLVILDVYVFNMCSISIILVNWSKVTNECPICKKKFTKVTEVLPPAEGNEGKKKGKKPKTQTIRNKVQRVDYADTGFAIARQREMDEWDDSDDSDDEHLNEYNDIMMDFFGHVIRGMGRRVDMDAPFDYEDSDDDEDMLDEIDRGLMPVPRQNVLGAVAGLMNRRLVPAAPVIPHRRRLIPQALPARNARLLGPAPRIRIQQRRPNAAEPILVDLVDSGEEDGAIDVDAVGMQQIRNNQNRQNPVIIDLSETIPTTTTSSSSSSSSISSNTVSVATAIPITNASNNNSVY